MAEMTRRVDAVVVGAGTAGANVACQLAERGWSVVLVERRRADAAGAQWHNAVLDWQFREAGVDPAEPTRPAGGTTHLFGPDGTHGVTVHDSPTSRADMALLGRQLRAAATDAGVDLVDGVQTATVEQRNGRVVALRIGRPATSTGAPTGAPTAAATTGPASTLRLEASLFVDASGRRGALRRQVPELASWCPEVRGDELCTATDHELRIDDPDGARRFLDRHGARPGDGVTVVGTDGGFSTRAITVSEDLSEAAILVGCLANGRYSSGPRMLAAARTAEPWLGDTISGGSGVIPLRRPYARLTAPGVALVGDAACQVFPGHGSGIGMGLMAGSLLADCVDGEADPGDPTVLWRYQAEFHHRHGGLLAAFDAFRRMSTALGSRGVTTMVRAGLLTEDMTRGGLDQRWQTPPPTGIPAMAARLASVPGVARRMLPLLARGQLLRPMGARYPVEADLEALARWDRTVARLLGPLPR